LEFLGCSNSVCLFTYGIQQKKEKQEVGRGNKKREEIKKGECVELSDHSQECRDDKKKSETSQKRSGTGGNAGHRRRSVI